MAEALVSSLVESVMGDLCSAVIKEIGLAWGLKNDLNNLESIFDTIQLVLQDAETKQRKSLPLQNWLRKLKNAAYDAEDILDEIATEGMRRRVDSKRGKHHKLKALISQRNPLIFSFKIARKVRNVRERLNAISEERLKFHLRERVKDNQNGDTFDNRQTSSLVNESEIYGRHEEKEMVVEKLLDSMPNQDDLSVYAICGMGGIGKTTLAQMVFNDERVDTHFKLRIWVCVSVDFSIPRLVRAILESVEGGGCNISELDQLLRRLQERLRGRKFLLVLDDVWNENDRQWDELKEALRCGSKGSALLVTTRIEKVALMMATVNIHHLRYLSEEESWSLFRKRAFASGHEDKNLEELGKEIVRKCGGVPLAVKALGSLMSYKTSESEWLEIRESEIWHLRDDNNGILSVLRLSYDNLSLQMRQCFAYCCIFPKDELMEKEKLVQLWMANGFIHSESHTDLLLAGHNIFKELVWRSFFQEVHEDDRGKIVCTMHDLMHDLAESVMKYERCILEIVNELNIPKMIRHLSVLRSRPYWLNNDKLKFSTDGSLRTVMVHWGAALPKGFSSFVSKQNYLRVLDMNIHSIEKSPNVFCKIKHLRYLVMSCQNYKRLPESLNCLLNLQTLKLTDSYALLELPKGLKYMKNLYFLEIEEWSSLVCTPPGLGELTCLRKLSVFIVGEDSAHAIGQLKDLINLGGELCIKGLGCIRDFEDAKSANLVTKKNLTSLDLSWDKGIKHDDSAEQYEKVLDGLQPNQNLERLSVEWYAGTKFPTWMSILTFNKLIKITMNTCYRCERLPSLGKLPSLVSLNLWNMESIKRLDDEWHGNGEISFPALKYLHFSKMPNLEKWITPDYTIENFPNLKVLEIENCPKLKEFPFLPTLRSLSLTGENTALLRSIMFLTSLTSLTLNSFSELDVLLERGLSHSNHEAESVVEPLSNLKILEIWYCGGLCSLPNWLGSLKSLLELEIHYCEKLNSLPENFQCLKSLRKLKISDCALLGKRCKKSDGEDWHKISHIPQIYINSFHNIQDS